MLKRLERLGWAQAALGCGLIYFTVTALGLYADGPNPDDWRQMAGAPQGGMPLNWTTEEGRWAMELIYVWLLGERFLTPLQILLAFPCLLGIARLLARHAAPETLGPASMLAIFAIGVNHVYMSDALNFSSHVFAYPLALLLSLGAFALIGPGKHGLFWRLPAAAGMLAVSAGIYQPFAVFGALLPLIGLMRWDRLDLPAALGWLARAALAGIAGLALYFLLWQIFAALSEHVPVADRFLAPTPGDLMAKLAGLPGLWRHLFTGGLMNLPAELRAFNGLAGLAVFAAVTAAGLAALRGTAGSGPGLLRVARVGLGGGVALLILPVLAWFAFTDPHLPGRTTGYLGFLIAACALAALALLAPLGRAGRMLKLAGAGGLALTGSIYLFTAAALWHDQARLGERDREIARLIMGRVAALPGYDGAPVRILGGLDSHEFSWGGLVGWTVFHAGNPVPGIFREMFGFGWTAEALAASPLACPAFPAHDAVYLHEGRAHVCLEAFARDLLPLTRCVRVGEDQIGTFCAERGLVILARPECTPPLPGRLVRARLLDDGGGPGQVIDFTVDARSFTHAGRCLQVWPDGGFSWERIMLGEYAADGRVLWEREIAAEALTETLAARP